MMSRRKRYTRNLGRRARAPLPARSTTEWVRFEHAREPFGVFSYLRDAERRLDGESREEIAALRSWFVDALDAPTIDGDADDRFWFRAEAAEHVTRARRLAALAREAGFPIVERRILRVPRSRPRFARSTSVAALGGGRFAPPGKVRWEDEHQVAVLTYRDVRAN